MTGLSRAEAGSGPARPRAAAWAGRVADVLADGIAAFGRSPANRAPLVRQTESAECGIACLAMVAAAHGLKLDLATLRERADLSGKGSTLADLARVADDLGLCARALRAEPGHLPQLAQPCVLHWDFDHFVVLTGVRRGIAHLHDPARGIRRLPLAELSTHFTGVVLELVPQAGFATGDRRRRLRLRELLGPVPGLRQALLRIFALAIALEGFSLLMPFFVQWVVDGVRADADRPLLAALGIGFALLVPIQVATGALRSWTVLHLASRLDLQWLGQVHAHLLRLPIGWFERRHVGDVMSRLDAVQKIQQTLTTSFIEAVLDGLLVVVTLAVMCVYSRGLTAIALTSVAAYAVLRGVFLRPLRDATEDAIGLDARRHSHLLESIRGVQAIKLFDRQADRHARFMTLAQDAASGATSTRRLALGFSVLHRLLFGLERVVVVWAGGLLVLEHRLSVGMLLAFFAFREQFALRVSGLIDKGVELRMLGLQGERLADIVLSAVEQADPPGPPRPAEPPALELRGLRFAYSSGDAEVLRGIDLQVAPGESVAIVGPSGCGKTTLLKLMLGVHAPTGGSVRVGGVPLADLGLSAWRRMIGTVMQDDVLFAGSIADNIAFFDAAPDLAWVAECAAAAAVRAEIEAMPMGFRTQIGDMGSTLSGGQKQRILLARALYKRPLVLFLDEATSALDVAREADVTRAIQALRLTRIIVAHRPETMAGADRVVVLQDGRVADDRRHPTLPA